MGMGKTIATPALLFLGVEDTFAGEWVHPVYLYEAALAGIIGLGLLVWVLRLSLIHISRCWGWWWRYAAAPGCFPCGG